MNTSQVLLTCGCVANSIRTHQDGKKLDPPLPTCVHGTTEVVKEMPDLTGRKAACTYGGNVRDSDWNLAFFEYKGPGSRDAEDVCKCGFHRSAHTPEMRAKSHRPGCDNFQPRGPAEYDKYYCGCYGWS